MMKYILIGVILMGLGFIFLFTQGFIKPVETPKYTLLSQYKNIELRFYPKLLIAEVETKGNQKSGISQGFSQLAGYIFGKNQDEKKITMTAPVLQEGSAKAWKIKFILPGDLHKSLLPKPDNHHIAFLNLENSYYVVIRFSGIASDTKLLHHTNILTTFLGSHLCHVTGERIYAFYNPPWTLPFLRRNEVWVPVKPGCKF